MTIEERDRLLEKHGLMTLFKETELKKEKATEQYDCKKQKNNIQPKANTIV